ncbi:MAG TPA: MBL fold metallo-hydrolase [Burkholderiales bacterium]|nr:MBL fold metallo-hydrolase [Burkholderiales bacterium]
MRLTFLGAAGEVTGSCYLVDTGAVRFIVDCGMFQGGHEADARNRAPFGFDPRSLDFVLLTHAHIDHSGLLPRLVAAGFAGPIFTTHATADLLRVMLLDSAHIQEKEAEWHRRSASHDKHESGFSEPLYTTRDVEVSLGKIRDIGYETMITPGRGVRCRFRDAGHILGAAIIETWVEENGQTRKIVFSGDIGQGKPLLPEPAAIEDADIVLVESTYGNRLHRSLPDTIKELTHAINDTLVHKRGNVIVPAFAVGRTQDLLYLLGDLRLRNAVPDLHIYVDSPLATQATEIMLRHRALLAPHTRDVLTAMLAGNGRPHVTFVESVEESIALNRIRGGALIISASGMCEGGRIKHHLTHNLGRRECTIIFAGFQAQGTLGRRIVDHASQVRIFGEEIPVRADVYTIGGLSAHADQNWLLAWLRHFRKPPRQIFIVHGEADAARIFRDTVQIQLGWNAVVPAAHSTVAL